MTRRKISPSRPTAPTPAAPTERFCGLIILPMTPPELLVAAMRMGSRPATFAVVAWSGPKSVFDEVSLPVRKTPSMPMKAEKNGKRTPVSARARAIEDVMPE